MKIVAFYSKQIVILGTARFLAWLGISGGFWVGDWLFAWLFSLAEVGLFLVLICTPVQLGLTRIRNDWFAYFAGALCGPAAVMLYLMFTPDSRPWLHAIFGVLGVWFAITYRRQLGPIATN